MANAVTFTDTGLDRLRDRVSAFSEKRAQQIMARTRSTLARRLPVRASELVVDKVINVTRGKARGYLSATVSGEAVTLLGLESRIPLSQFIGTRYGGRKTPGATVKKWKDSPAEVYSAARAREVGGNQKGGAFAIKGRGVRGGIYQRVDKKIGGTKRDVVALRKGPSFARAITDKTHGDIYPDLINAGREVLRAEMIRLSKGK